MTRGTTDADVWRACDAILQEGARPTIARVRQKLGRGSPNTVSPHLDSWFRGLGARLRDPLSDTGPAGLPDPVLQAARQLWENALAHTREDFDHRLREALASAVANVEAEKERAAQAAASAFDATGRMRRLAAERAQWVEALDAAKRAQADLADRLQRALDTIAALTANGAAGNADSGATTGVHPSPSAPPGRVGSRRR